MEVLNKFLEKNRDKRIKIAVIGDALLDEYYAVKVNRISPEFPIEVMLSETDEPLSVVPGGAANVCYQMKYWNVDAYLLSVVDRESGESLSGKGFNTQYCVDLDGWKTPRKKRFYDGDFPIGRWDVESKKCVFPEGWSSARECLISNIKVMIDEVKPDFIIISDYGKGIFNSYEESQEIINYCGTKGISTIVDPKNLDYRFWEGCAVLKPNAEWVKAFCDKYNFVPKKTGVKWDEELKFVYEKIKPVSIVLTDSGTGMAHYSPMVYENVVFKSSCELSSRRPVIRSVIGAGDCFCAFLAMNLAHNSGTLDEMIKIAFNGSSAYIEDKHNSPVTPYVLTKWFDPIQAKKVSLEELLEIKKQLGNKTWVFCNGCYDTVPHSGHLKTFTEARKIGDIVVVGLNTDESIKNLKGESRPIFSYETRTNFLANLQNVDFIVPIIESTPRTIIESLKPNRLVKGMDYKVRDIAGWDIVGEENVHLVPLIDNISTTNILNNNDFSLAEIFNNNGTIENEILLQKDEVESFKEFISKKPNLSAKINKIRG